VEEFKPIYFMEWFHRMWGRSLGVVFAVPFIGFAAKGWIPRNMYPRMALMFSMGGLQVRVTVGLISLSPSRGSISYTISLAGGGVWACGWASASVLAPSSALCSSVTETSDIV